MKYKARLLDGVTTDVSGDTIDSWQGGRVAVIHLTGTIDGATATIYIDVGLGFGTNATELAMTELGIYSLPYVPNDAIIKCTVSGAGAGTDLDCLMVDA